jgi:hypothetical protein
VPREWLLWVEVGFDPNNTKSVKEREEANPQVHMREVKEVLLTDGAQCLEPPEFGGHCFVICKNDQLA